MVSGVTHNVGPYLRPKLVNVLADAGRFTNCGSLAMSAAMRRASSRVGKLAGQKRLLEVSCQEPFTASRTNW